MTAVVHPFPVGTVSAVKSAEGGARFEQGSPAWSCASDAAGDAAGPQATTPRLSVVMPTYKRPDLLTRCLDKLVDQSLPGAAYEIIVVDDGQTDDSRAVVEAFAARTNGQPLIRYLRPLGTRGPAAARNRGWREARAPLVAFTDDDTEPDRDWLLEAERAMETPAVGRLQRMAVSGRVVVPTSDRPTDHERMTKGLEDAEFVTANAIVRRCALEAVGGFDERFKRAWREDSDLHFGLLDHFGEVSRADRAIVVHPVRQAPWGISLRQQENSAFEALLYKKHPALYRQKILRFRPWLYYGIVAATLVMLGCLIAAHWTAALVAAVVALAGIVRFAAIRLKGAAHTPAHVWEMVATSFAIPFLSVYWRLVGAWRFRFPFI
ncbi:MAG: glycosyl transferase family 2 [Rhizobacter sp.]|nr:glycosyl transferase family 2 [Rhizobacter sp.]